MTTIVTMGAITTMGTGAFASRGTLRLAEGAAHSFAQDEQTVLAEPRWYAAYTCAQHEKRVAEQLVERTVEHFLPLYASVRRWKDRRVALELPLFPGYVFVRLALRDRLRVLQVPSVVRLVGFGGLPTALPDEQVEILRAGPGRAIARPAASVPRRGPPRARGPRPARRRPRHPPPHEGRLSRSPLTGSHHALGRGRARHSRC